jgi:hypothetical protein
VISTLIIPVKYCNNCLHICKWIVAGFDINQANCPMAYNVLGRVLFKRYKTDLMIYLYMVISSPFRRDSSSLLTDLSTIPAGIERLVEFAFVIFVRSKSFRINVDYVIIRVRFLLFLVISNPIKQLIGPRSLPFYSLRILFFILLTSSCFPTISILLINRRTNTRFLINRLGSESAAHRPNTSNASLIIWNYSWGACFRLYSAFLRRIYVSLCLSSRNTFLRNLISVI